MYSQEEKATAKAIVENKSYMELLTKVFLQKEDRINPDIALAKTNEQLGEIIRADLQAEEKIKDRFDILKRLSIIYEGKDSKVRE